MFTARLRWGPGAFCRPGAGAAADCAEPCHRPARTALLPLGQREKLGKHLKTEKINIWSPQSLCQQEEMKGRVEKIAQAGLPSLRRGPTGLDLSSVLVKYAGIHSE